MLRNARKSVGISIEEAAHRIGCAPRTLVKYESNETTPKPEIILEMASVYQVPWLTLLYCKDYCRIGNAFSYEILNNVDLSLTAVLSSLEEEMEEATGVIKELRKLARNKQSSDDFGENELKRLRTKAQEVWDVEHNIEVLKLALSNILNMQEEIRKHNQKCIQRKYATNELEKLFEE